jgi:predicted phage-related endonuclease
MYNKDMQGQKIIKKSFTENQKGEWLALRKQKITGHDAVKLLGLSPYGDFRDVWNDKVENHKIEETEAMKWGKDNEPIIAERAITQLQKQDLKISANLDEMSNYTVFYDSWRLASPDVYGESKIGPVIIECKATRSEINDEKLTAWKAQLAWYCHLLNATGFIASLVEIPGSKPMFKLFTLKKQEINNFYTTNTLEYLRQWHIAIIKKEINLAPNVVKLEMNIVEKFKDVAQKKKEYEKQYEMLKNEILAKINNNNSSKIPIVTANQLTGTITIAKRQFLDSNALKEAHPEIYQEFCAETTYRRIDL